MKHIFVLLIAVLAIPALAQSQTDKDSAKALQDTQALLRDKTARHKAVSANPQAKDMDDKVTALMGSGQNKEDMYELSAQLMEKIVKETGGDPAKMQALLEQAQKDPQGFYNKYMSADQKAKISSIAAKVDKTSSQATPAH